MNFNYFENSFDLWRKWAHYTSCWVLISRITKCEASWWTLNSRFGHWSSIYSRFPDNLDVPRGENAFSPIDHYIMRAFAIFLLVMWGNLEKKRDDWPTLFLKKLLLGTQANRMPKKKSFHFEVMAPTNPKNELRIRSARVILYYGLY